MFLKHLVIVPVVFIVALSLGWFGRLYFESKMAVNETSSATKAYQGFDFSFEYPVSYTASEDGLWTKDRYEFSLNLPEYSDVGSLPDIKLVNDSFSGSVKEYFEMTLKVRFKEGSNTDNLSFEEIFTDNVDGSYYKIIDYEMLKQVYYVKQNGNRIVGFETFNPEEGHETEILAMLKSLLFK